MSARPLVGIDLGTTNSLVAVFTEGEPRLVPNAHGDVMTPSAVGVLPSGEVVVGHTAVELALTHPDRVARFFKRHMGQDREIEVAGRTFSPQELSSLVLGALAKDAEAHLGEPPGPVVITVPAYFNQLQRAATRLAAELAGLEVARIVNEPTAAALTYGFHEREADQKLVVFDLGGGTFDVTVMEIFEGTLEILSTAGESMLGGEDFTERLLAHVLRGLDRNLEHAELSAPLMVSRLRSEVEAAKRTLSSADAAEIRIPSDDGEIPPDGQRVRISAAEFAEALKPLLERLERPTRRALRDAELLPKAVDEVILVGGATRTAAVGSLVRDLFGRSPSVTESGGAPVHPDHAVALGAAVQAALVADDAAVDDLVMTDVCPHTLGVAISKEMGSQRVDGYFLPVIHRGTTIPVSREERVATVENGQQEVTVRVFQGEARRTDENTLLGELAVQGLPVREAGLEIILRFTYDLNGLLEVEAIVPEGDLRVSTVLRQASAHMGEAEVRAAVAKMQALKVYPREKLENRRLLAFGSAALQELVPGARRELEEALDVYERWLADNDAERFEEARQHLLMTLSRLDIPYAEGQGEET